MPEEPARRPLQVDISTLDLVHARTEALRLLASAETDLDVHLTEAARVLTDLFDGLVLDAVEDAELSTLTHRVLEIVAGLIMVASRSVDKLAEIEDGDRVEILRQIETEIEADTD